MKIIIQLGLALALVGVVSIDASGRGFGGFRGGGFHAGGFGGYHAGGYHAGGFDTGGYHAGGFEAGGYHASGFTGYGGDRANTFSSNAFRAGAYGGDLNRGELSSFLGMPTDGGMHAASGAVAERGVAASPYGFAAGRAGAAGHVYQGPGGTTVAHGVAGEQGIAAGPGGAAAGSRVASGTAVKGPNGNVYTHSTTAARGIAAGPNGVAAGRGIATSASATGAFGHYSATAMHAQGLACQRWRSGSRIFTAGWCGAHPWGWHPAAYSAAAWATAAWRWATWPAVGDWLAFSAPEASYDYGDNITYQNGEVYYGTDPVATQQEYFNGASTLASSGASAAAGDGGDWLPLGVFGLVAPGGTTPTMVFQLAINKQGIIHGNYYDQLAEVNLPVYGSVDKANQRVAWQIGKNKSNVVETGLYNLTQNVSTALIHLGPDDTQQVTLVRIKQPTDGDQPGAEQPLPTP